jgi:hypothetical protein
MPAEAGRLDDGELAGELPAGPVGDATRLGLAGALAAETGPLPV